MITKLTAIEFKDHFSGHAKDYAKYRPGYPKQLYEFIYKHVEALVYIGLPATSCLLCNIHQLLNRLFANYLLPFVCLSSTKNFAKKICHNQYFFFTGIRRKITCQMRILPLSNKITFMHFFCSKWLSDIRSLQKKLFCKNYSGISWKNRYF